MYDWDLGQAKGGIARHRQIYKQEGFQLWTPAGDVTFIFRQASRTLTDRACYLSLQRFSNLGLTARYGWNHSLLIWEKEVKKTKAVNEKPKLLLFPLISHQLFCSLLLLHRGHGGGLQIKRLQLSVTAHRNLMLMSNLHSSPAVIGFLGGSAGSVEKGGWALQNGRPLSGAN